MKLTLILLLLAIFVVATAQKSPTDLADAVARNSQEITKAVALIQTLASRVGAVAAVNQQREYHYGPLAASPGRVYVLPGLPPGGVASISHVELERETVHEGADFSFTGDTLTPNTDWGGARVWISVWGGVQ